MILENERTPPAVARIWSTARVVLALGFVALVATSCVVRETRRAPCSGGVWMDGHRGPRGRWHPGHWRCPGQPVIIEVE